ncbi:MAG: hypothetical protein GF383_02945, partial [Candidatus Lokiarchaeota archaeon]|nr:hypothetical protein [Candidatus Lokiarchaeota archaeon]
MVKIEKSNGDKKYSVDKIICPNCNVKLEPDSVGTLESDGDSDEVFCQYCGAKLELKRDLRILPEFEHSLKEEEKVSDILPKDSETEQEELKREESPLDPMYSDPDFTDQFRDNLIRVISRIIFVLIKKLEMGERTGKINLKLGDPLKEELKRKYFQLQRKGFNPFFFKGLPDITPSDFKTQLNDFEDKLQQGADYYQSFLYFLEQIIEMIYKIIYKDWGKAKPHWNRIQIRNDIITFYFIKLYWYPMEEKMLKLLDFNMRPILAHENRKFHTPFIISHKNMPLIIECWKNYGFASEMYPNEGTDIKKDFFKWIQELKVLSEGEKADIIKTCRTISKEEKLKEYLLFKLFFSNDGIEEIVKEAKRLGLHFTFDELRNFAYKKAYEENKDWYSLRFSNDGFEMKPVESASTSSKKTTQKTPPPEQEKSEVFKKNNIEELLPKPRSKKMSKRILALVPKLYPIILRQTNTEFDLEVLAEQCTTKKLDEKTVQALILVIYGTIRILQKLVWNTLYTCLRNLSKEDFIALSEKEIIENLKQYYEFSAEAWLNILKKSIPKYAGNNIDYIRYLSLQTDMEKLLNRLLQFDYNTDGPSVKHEILKYKLILGELFNFTDFPSKKEIMKKAEASIELIYRIGHHINRVSREEGEYFSLYERFIGVDMEKSLINPDKKMIYGFPQEVRRHICRFLYSCLDNNELFSENISLESKTIKELGSLLTTFFLDGEIKRFDFIQQISRFLRPLFRTFTIHGEKKSVPMVIWALKSALEGLNAKGKALLADFFKALILMVHRVIGGFQQNTIDKEEFEKEIKTKSFSGFMDGFIDDISFTITRKFSLRP